MRVQTATPAESTRQVLSSTFRCPAYSLLSSTLSTLQLPIAPENFQGRDEVVRQAVDLLIHNEQGRVFVSGPGGIGKTSLALTVVHDARVIIRFGDCRYWVPCDQAPTPAAFIQLVARSLEITLPPNPTDPFKALVTALRASEDASRLLILDNFETTWDTDEQPEVDKILCNLAILRGISILMTTRDSQSTAFSLSWSRPLLRPLDTLSLDSARAIYLHHLPDSIHDDQLDPLLLAIDCYPLAIELMARQGELGNNPSDLRRRWEVEKSKLLAHGRHKGCNLEVSMELSLQSGPMLDNPGALDVLSVLALLPAATTIEMLPHIPDLPNHLDTLTKVSLASRRAGGSFITILSPIRAYVLKRYPPKKDILDSMCSVYDHRIKRWKSTPKKSDIKEAAAYSLTYPEESNIESVLRYSMVNGDQNNTFTSIVDYTEYLSWCHPNPHLLHFALDQVGSGLVSPFENARAQMMLGYTLCLLCNFPEAIDALQLAESLFEITGNQVEAARCEGTLAHIFCLEGRLLESRKMLQSAEDTFKALGDLERVAHCQVLIAELLIAESRYSEVEEKLQSARSFFEDGDILRQISGTRLRLAHFLQTESTDYVQAERILQETLSTHRAENDTWNMAYFMVLIGEVVYASGRVMEARKYLEDAVVISRESGHTVRAEQWEDQLREWSQA